MMRYKHVFSQLTLSIVLLAARPALADPLASAAERMATELANAAVDKLGTPRPSVVLKEVAIDPSDPDATRFVSALSAALAGHAKLKLVDRSAVQAAIAEANVQSTDEALTSIAEALGAAALVTVEVSTGVGGHVASARLLSLKGEVLAATRATFGADAQDAAPLAALDVQIRRLTDLVAQGLDQMDGERRYQRFAVLPFEEAGELTKKKQLGLLVSSELTTALRRDFGLLLVERAQLAKVVDELALGQSGLVDEKQVVEVGKLTGADGLILGTVAEAGDRYQVSVRVVAASTGEVVVANEVALPAADLVALSSEAVVLRTRAGAIYRSILLPGWGQVYNREPFKASLFVAVEAAVLGGALFEHVHGTGLQSDYNALDATSPTAQFSTLPDRAHDALLWRNRLLWGALAVHLLNVADAFFNGKTFDNAQASTGSGPLGWQF